MIPTVTTVAATREACIDRMRRALDEYYVTGIKTTIPFHSAIMRNADFRAGNSDTGFVERVMTSEHFELKPTPPPPHHPPRRQTPGPRPARPGAVLAVRDDARTDG